MHLKDRTYSAVITDMRLPDGTGLELLRRLEEAGRREKTIVITAYGSAENAVEALKAGAYDYLTKPVDLKQFRAVVASALGRGGPAVPTMDPSTLPSENGAPPTLRPARWRAKHRGAGQRGLRRMAGHSAAMQQVRALVEKVARSMAPVLVNGESGTGKELVARAIHEISVRAAQPFIAVNCGAIPEQLLEAEFFGYRKGVHRRQRGSRGFFQAANGGTLFLDEIGDLPLSMQSKLLRSIQERSVRPVGAVSEQAVNVRLLSATHKDLAAEVHAGRFRQDLFYRLNVIQIRVPPLRERLDDLPDITERVLERIASDAGVSPAPRLTREALQQLACYAFPATCASWRTCCTARWRCPAARPSASPTSACPKQLGRGPSSPTTRCRICARSRSTNAARFPPPPRACRGEPLPSDLAAYLDDVERDILVRARAPSLQPHRGRREPRAVAAADALSHGAPGRERRQRRHRRRTRLTAREQVPA